ncbi:glycosyl hydrolase family 71-domain-containing protein [Aspergillus cavernicola]|uniref:Glycosyl hydrolase family 71-domain-containing protein n=1 Tax=Aspergillus cavernicola TaxID=176166 RepID=A0ABR4HG26_9EURO
MPSSTPWTPSWTWILLTTLLTLPSCIQSKAVFAHFMLANTENYTVSTWKTDIHAAKSSLIDAFALNTGHGMNHTTQSLNDAFTAAEELDFKLFFSLDYSGAGPWPKNSVIELLKRYTGRSAYFQHDGKPLVSTFEGFQHAGDWADIKSEVSSDVEGCCFFIPDWTSVGPRRATSSSSSSSSAAVPVIDGLMSWDAWPDGANPMNTSEDLEYMSNLASRPYIMPVSPWFYTNLKQFNKNWVWRGDDLWYTRWQQVLEVQPEYVEILTWNDYGESHYIGPLREEARGVFGQAGALFDYAEGMDHDGWRVLLPYLIGVYKGDIEEGEVEEEVLSVWYRLSPAGACGDGGTMGNTESQNQVVLEAGEVLEDKVFYSAVLEGDAEVRVSIGGVNRSVEWTGVPEGGKGVYHGSVDMEDRTGQVVVTLSRDGEFLAQMKGRGIETSCGGNLTNWNAWVGNATAVSSKRRGGDGGGGGEESTSSISFSVQMWGGWIVIPFRLSVYQRPGAPSRNSTKHRSPGTQSR